MRRLPFFLLFFAAVASAQTATLDRPFTAPRGAALPPTSAALVDDASALTVNPAALTDAAGTQLYYLHERTLIQDGLADGLFLSSRWFGTVGTALSTEWIRGHGEPAYRKSGLGFSVGSEALSLGAAYHWFSSDSSRSVDRLAGWDLGLASRPLQSLSFAATVQNVDQPRLGLARLSRQYDFAVGVRPFGERLSLGVDYLFTESLPEQGRLNYTVQGTLWRGLGLSFGLSHGFEGQPVIAQLAATLDTGHLGLTYAAGAASSKASHIVAVRLMSEPSPHLIQRHRIALLDLDDALRERGSPALALLGLQEEDPYLQLTRWLDEASRDPELAGVVVKIQSLPQVGWGKAEELRQALLRFRAAKKHVTAWLLSADDSDYFIASAADEIYALPESMLLINGLSASVLTLGGTMEKLGVSWDVARVGDYKTAPELFTRQQMSDPQRETLNAFLDTQVKVYETAVTTSRRIPVSQLQAAWAEGILSPAKAQTFGLVDGVRTPEALEKQLQTKLPGTFFDANYSPRRYRDRRWGNRPRIAIVPVVGNIAGGKSRADPLGVARIAGAETVVQALQRAQQDPQVRAIVLRVDSGGGEVLASDLMYRAVLEAKKHKPVIASMGDVAASGGYYAAMATHEIYATPATLTGSIGVFFMKPALQKLGEKLGVHQETISKAPLANVTSTWSAWTPEEQKVVQAWVNATYDGFITEVATSRKLDKTHVDTLARGRVWSGADALTRGLVDALGGMQEAVTAARQRAGLSAKEEVDWVVFGEPSGPLASLGGEPGVLARFAQSVSPSPFEPAQKLLQESGLSIGLFTPSGMQAQLPYEVRLR